MIRYISYTSFISLHIVPRSSVIHRIQDARGKKKKRKCTAIKCMGRYTFHAGKSKILILK